MVLGFRAVRTTQECLGITQGDRSRGILPQIMDNQMEKNVGNKIETGGLIWVG